MKCIETCNYVVDQKGVFHEGHESTCVGFRKLFDWFFNHTHNCTESTVTRIREWDCTPQDPDVIKSTTSPT